MQRKHLPLIFLPLLAMGAGCTPLYTTDQVNATVSAKIKEVAAYQKINVTVETVILKEYIVVTPTLAPTVPQPLPYSTITPIGFNRYKPEDIFAQIELSGYQVRQFFFDLPKDSLGTAGRFVFAATNFIVEDNGIPYEGIIFKFNDEESLLTAYELLGKSPVQPNGSLFRVGNFLIEMEAETIGPILEKFSALTVQFQ